MRNDQELIKQSIERGLISNIVKSINIINRLVRRLSVLPFLDFIRIIIQTWNAKHNEVARNTKTNLTVKYNEIFKVNSVLSYKMMVSHHYLQIFYLY